MQRHAHSFSFALLAVFLLAGSSASAYYDPATGRFLSPDPARFADSRNLYAYCANDPVNGFDPDGMLQANPEHQSYNANVIDRVQYASSSVNYVPSSVSYKSSDVGNSLASLLFNPVTQSAYQQMNNPMAGTLSKVLSGAVVAMMGAIDVASLATPMGDELAAARAEMTAARTIGTEMRAATMVARIPITNPARLLSAPKPDFFIPNLAGRQITSFKVGETGLFLPAGRAHGAISVGKYLSANPVPNQAYVRGPLATLQDWNPATHVSDAFVPPGVQLQMSIAKPHPSLPGSGYGVQFQILNDADQARIIYSNTRPLSP